MKASAIGAVVLLACGSVAHAQTTQPVPVGTPPGTRPVLAAPVTQPLPPSRWTAAQIREAFQLGDGNGDGQLTRAEAQRLAILPRSFEDADLNKDGVLTLDEYQASFGNR